MPDKIALITWTFELVTGTIKRIVIYTRTEGEGEEKVLQFAFAHAIERKKVLLTFGEDQGREE